MRVILAMTWATWKAASSYRMATVFSLLGLVLTIVPLYFVANALQATMSQTIQGEGSQYFAFVLAGIIGTTVITQAVSSMPSSVGAAATGGTLDSLLLTPTPMVTLFAGLTAYGFLWTAVRIVLLLLGGVVLGASVHWSGLPAALFVLVLLTAAYVPIGLVLTASVVAFRTSGPLLPGVLLVSTLLGGVYYPVHVVPSWLQIMTAFVPLTYGLRAFRQLLLEGAPLTAVASDMAILLLFAVVLGVLSTGLVVVAFRYARRTGSLSTD